MEKRELLKKMSCLSDDNRLKIIYILSKESFCSVHLEKLLGVSQSNVSRHLEKLLDVNIIKVSKVGRRKFYILNKEFQVKNEEFLKEINEVYTCKELNELIKKEKTTCENYKENML